ncbi:methyl transferase [Streptococcus pneumoniae]|nr:methyl transferase [Streptococcus pneumoniae]
MTSQQYQMNLFEESEVWTLSVEDFRAKLSQLQETDEVLKIHEELCSLKLLGSQLHSRPLSQPWMNWGTTWNGKCLTARISESPKIGNECSLSDILEENVPEEFFLSAEKISQLVTNQS